MAGRIGYSIFSPLTRQQKNGDRESYDIPRERFLNLRRLHLPDLVKGDLDSLRDDVQQYYALKACLRPTLITQSFSSR